MYTASTGGDSSGEECGLQIDVGKTDGRQSKAREKGTKVTKPVDVSWKPGEGKGKEEIQAFTSASLPLTANSEVSILAE